MGPIAVRHSIAVLADMTGLASVIDFLANARMSTKPGQSQKKPRLVPQMEADGGAGVVIGIGVMDNR